MTFATEVRYGKRHQCPDEENALSLSLSIVAQKRSKLRKEDVKDTFLQGHGTGQNVKLVAEPVVELPRHLHISPNQVVVSTKHCC